ncbi:hypothetical protein BBP00_00008393 [Phytophthora kernoviae]|uniref:Uncharacterized protein n=1 Tax=Phytophthora kernoviae TaxID=325452 RepID=A0A3F2RFJ8_9STRA|nr:hypothetical protein BBP00_00008393 [Phytophthora kernoviae]
MQVLGTNGDAFNWRQAFDSLVVFEQEFDTAMQILMYQDEKVARLSLEESSQTTGARRTGSGKSVTVSKAALETYENKLRAEDEMVAADTTAGRSVASLFQTGSGKSVTVSKAALETYENKLRAEDEMVAADTTAGRSVASLFQTGSGKSVTVSKAALETTA